MFEQPIRDGFRNETIDIAKVLYHNRIMIGAIVIVCICIGVLVSVFIKKVYVVDSLIEVGTFLGTEDASVPIERPRQLTEKIITGSYDEAIRKALKMTDNQPLNIKAINPDTTNLVHIYIHSTRPDTDIQVLEKINQIILDEHVKRFQSRGVLMGTVSTVVAKEPTIASNPSNQKPILTIVFSFFAGMVIAVLFVFGRDWWQRSLSV